MISGWMWVAFCWGLSLEAGAQESGEDQPSLPEITVTADLRGYPSTTGTTSEHPANSATLYGRVELESSYHRNPNELLRGTPGLNVHKASEGRGTDVQIRGVTAGQGMVSFDGVPLLTTLPGLTWFDSIPAEALDSITVVRGANHAYHTGQSLGGSIQLRSKQARENYAYAHMEGGSFGTLRETVSGGLRTGGVHVAATGSRIDLFQGAYHAIPERGNPERDPFRSTLGMLRFGVEPPGPLKLDGSFLYKHSMFEIDLPGVTAAGLPDIVDDPDSRLEEDLWLAQLAADTAVTGAWRSQLQLAVTANEIGARIMALPASFDSHLLFADWRNVHRIPGGGRSDHVWSFVWGGAARREAGSGESFLSPVALRRERGTVSGFAELAAAMDRWQHEAGLRLEHHEEFGDRVLLHLGSRWQVMPGFALHAGAGTGFRPPSLGELFIPLVGNPALKPEQGVNGEAGVELSVARARLAVAGFYGRHDDLVTVQISPGVFFGIDNLPEVRARGIEISAQYPWNAQLGTGVDFTWQEVRDLDTGRDVPLRPEVSGRLWAQWHAARLPLIARVTAHYRSGYWNDIANTLRSRGALRLSASLAYFVTPAIDLYIRGENITDDGTRDFFAHFSPGATVYGGVHLRY
jgi:outer membrane cobalamin receptor